MNDDDLNDSAVLSAVRDSISGLPMPAAPRLEAITARGRARRRRRLGGLSIAGAGAGACAALVVGLAGGWARPGRRPAPPGQRHTAKRLRSTWRRSRSSPAPTVPRR